ncbi:tetratricopeptide repeat protein [Spirulina sp. CCNP1310]|uniref:tetratricopeptide repeat protein n=1 Tax=Spirulina sp. CCNP1310 TaxID=3110249 RepID=UPI002B220FBF|nr:tetratricopeptide repeat protein [Spirulina sp. CCNP1310]MEA5418020.1 tetratricopeptide repeat protein [Spirulina sp. CCNP1310]
MSLQRLAVFGGLTVAGLLCGGAPGIVPILAAAGSSVTGGVAANELGGLLDRLRRSGDDLSNHDLTKAVGRAIGRSILGFAQDHLEEIENKALQKLGKDLPEIWPSFVKPLVTEQTLLKEIQEAQLTAWLTDPEAQRGLLAVSEWETAITQYFCPSVDIELKRDTVRDLAAHLQNTFAFALREVLKADFETGGKAFAGMTLSMLGEILKTVQGLQSAGNGSISQDLVDQIQARYEALHQNQTVFLQAIAAQIGRDLADLKAGQTLIIDKIDASTERILEAIAQQPQPAPRPPIIQNEPRPKATHWQGRDAEQAQLNAWLDDENTKLSGLIAMAGMGKSTLAVKVFEDRADFVGKGWFDLGFAPRFDGVARSLLDKWGEIPRDVLERMSSEQLTDELIALLQNERFLLVLDNLESVLDQPEYVTFLQRWANGGRRSEVLITSQQEPEIDQVCPAWCVLSGLESEEGAKLLAALRITEQEPGKLEEFSELVDGHPLTLTLTAGLLNSQGSRQRQKSIEELQSPEFGDLLSRLAGQHRNQRVQLTAVLAANFERLSPREREVLTRLAVLRGSFGEDVVTAAESGLFWGLVNRGLLMDQGGEGVTVLPFVRSYLLSQVDDLAPLHRWAVDYYDARKKPYPWDVFEADRERELADVQAYLELFHHHFELGEYEQAFDLIYDGKSQRESVDDFLDLRGFQQERIALYEPLIEVWCDHIHLRYTLSLDYLGHAYDSLGNYTQSIKYQEFSLEIKRQTGNKLGEANSLSDLGNSYDSLGNYEKAIDYHKKSLLIARELNDERGESAALGNTGNAYYTLGKLHKAIDLHEQHLKLAQKIKDRQGEADALNNLGNNYYQLGELEKALDYWIQSLSIDRQLKNKQGESISIGNIGNIYSSFGDQTKAIEHHKISLEIAETIKYYQGQVTALGCLGDDYYLLEEFQKSIDYYKKQLSISKKIKYKKGEMLALENLGYAYNSLRDFNQAIYYHEKSLAITQQIKNSSREMKLLLKLFPLYLKSWKFKKIFAVILDITKNDKNLSLNSLPYPQWLKRLITFVQTEKEKGTAQFILLCILGALAFPLAFIWIVLLTLWRILRRPV